MPIYEYSCSACGKTTDVLQKLDDPAPAKCEQCGAEGKLERVVSRTSFVLKGGGWYSDLYGSTKKGGGDPGSAKGSSSGEKGAGSGESSGTAKPAEGGKSSESKPAEKPAASPTTPSSSSSSSGSGSS